MKVTVDTNVLVRAVVGDNPDQSRIAAALLEDAEIIAIPLPCLCEFVWVLRGRYRFSPQNIVRALEALLVSDNVAVDRQAVEAGLAVLRAGGDFADGLIAHEGHWLGGETFVSFDKQAVALIARQGHPATLLA